MNKSILIPSLIMFYIGCSYNLAAQHDHLDEKEKLIQHQFGTIHDPDPPEKATAIDAKQVKIYSKNFTTVRVNSEATLIDEISEETYKKLLVIHDKILETEGTAGWTVYKKKEKYVFEQSEEFYLPVYKKNELDLKHGEGVYFCLKNKKMNDFAGIGGRWVMFAHHVTKNHNVAHGKCHHKK